MILRQICRFAATAAAIASLTAEVTLAADSPIEPIEIVHGVCMLVPTLENEVAGLLILEQMDDHLHIQGEVLGLTPGQHGFHIHEFGDLRDPQGKAAGGHYNPAGHPHGGPDDDERHAGDLGNIEADTNGVAPVDIKATGLKLHHILGRSIVVKAGEDDLKSQPAGNSGPRVAVGVIGLAAEPMIDKESNEPGE